MRRPDFTGCFAVALSPVTNDSFSRHVLYEHIISELVKVSELCALVLSSTRLGTVSTRFLSHAVGICAH